MKRTMCILLALLFPSFFLHSPVELAGSSQSADLPFPIADTIDYGNIQEHVVFLSSLGSRVTGYEGCSLAADYIEDEFADYGLEVIRQDYRLLTPLDHGSDITVLQESGEIIDVVEAHALWPNYVQTSKTSNDVEGPLVYVGRGDLKDFNGRTIEGSIVLMDFNSEDNWINAAKLGAKAVVFVAPEETSYLEARKKILNTPVHFPRVYVNSDDGLALKNLARLAVTVRVNLDMTYDGVKASNIIGMMNGTKHPDEIIIVAAHYDTWSVVPALAPGADEATGTASLLELARYFGENPPTRSIWFVALSGHWQALAGSREFVEEYFFRDTAIRGVEKMWGFVGLDLSTDGDGVAFLYRGHLYEFGSDAIVARWTNWLQPRIFQEYLPALEDQTNMRYSVENGFRGQLGWWASVFGPYMLDSEPFAIAHGLGFTIRTNNVRRWHWGHPLTHSSQVNYDNLKPQVEVASATVYGLANEDTIDMDYFAVSPARYLFKASGADVAGFLTVKGSALEFNVTTGWYAPVPNSIVSLVRQSLSFSTYPFNRILTFADDDGRFEVHGVSGFGYGHGYGSIDEWYVEAYHIDENTGLMDYAPDYGQYGQGQISFTYLVNTQPFEVTTVLFRSSAAVLFDLLDPLTFQPSAFFDPRFENRGGGYGAAEEYTHVFLENPITLTVYDFETISEYTMWGTYLTGHEKVGMIFVPPMTKFMLILKAGSLEDIVGILLNATSEKPGGESYLAGDETELRLSLTALRFAGDLLLVTQDRYSRLNASFAQSMISERYLTKSSALFEDAMKALRNRQYDLAYTKSFAAWNWAIRAYANTMTLVNDTLVTNIVFFSLFIVFSVLLLVFSSGIGIRARYALLVSVFSLLLLTYNLVHPAPRLAVSFAMSPLSTSLLFLYSFIAAIFVSEALGIIKITRLRAIGPHFQERATFSIFLIAFKYGLESIRRRKLRTSLTIANVIIITFSIVSLTSVVPNIDVDYSPVFGAVPSFKGLQLKHSIERSPSNIYDPLILDMLKSYPDVTVAPRTWFYPQSKGGREVSTKIYNEEGNTSFTIRAILGLSAEEAEIFDYETALTAGGRFFLEEDYWSCMLTEPAANTLKVKPGDVVNVGSMSLRVVGVLKLELVDTFRDLDGWPVTPADPQSIPVLLAGQVLEVSYITLSWDQIMVVPYKLALDIGGYVATIAISGDNVQTLNEVGEELALVLDNTHIYINYENGVYGLSRVFKFSLLGWTPMLLVMVLGSFTIFSALLGSIVDRASEMEIYSIVGLSPKGVMAMFFAESALYAFTAGVIGQLSGIVVNVLLLSSGYLPPGFIANSSSASTIIAVGIPMLFILLSAVYPAITASKSVTPSLERKWKLTSRPKGDSWEIPLPFTVERKEEAVGILNFLDEYFVGHTIETPESFIVRESKLTSEKLELVTTVSLRPFEKGLSQRMEIKGLTSETVDRVSLYLVLTRLSGDSKSWQAINYKVVDSLRKQFLIWRSLSPEHRRKYERQKQTDVQMGQI